MYKANVIITVPAGTANQTWTAQLYNEAGATVGIGVTTGFVQLDATKYLWTYDQFGDTFYGAIKFTSAPAGLIRWATMAPTSGGADGEENSYVGEESVSIGET